MDDIGALIAQIADRLDNLEHEPVPLRKPHRRNHRRLSAKRREQILQEYEDRLREIWGGTPVSEI